MIVTVYLKYLCAPLLMSIFVSFRGSISFIRVAHISLSRVQHQLCGWLVIFFFFLLIFKRIFLIPVALTELRRCAALPQPGSFKHGEAQSDLLLHMVP